MCWGDVYIRMARRAPLHALNLSTSQCAEAPGKKGKQKLRMIIVFSNIRYQFSRARAVARGSEPCGLLCVVRCDDSCPGQLDATLLMVNGSISNKGLDAQCLEPRMRVILYEHRSLSPEDVNRAERQHASQPGKM